MDDNYAINCGNRYWETNDTLSCFNVMSLCSGYSTAILTGQQDM